MKSKVVKCLVLASALAFMNCGEEAVIPNMPENPGIGEQLPGGDVQQPGEQVIPGETLPGEQVVPGETLPGEQVVPGETLPDETVVPGETLPGETVVPGETQPGENVVPGETQPGEQQPGEQVGPGETPSPAPSSSATVEVPASSAEAPVVSSSSEAPAPKGIFLAEGTDEDKDYLPVEYFTNTGDNHGGVLAYPKNLSTTQKHGVVLWGPGGGTAPTAYEGIIRRLASHGFVVIATSESPDGTNRGKPALNWLAEKNNTPGDPLYQKLDMTKVGASGHSMGGLQSEEMLIDDDRVITAVLNNSGDMGHADAARIPTSKTFAIVYGEGGMERPNAEADYGNANVKAPGCLIKMTGGQGNECQQGECGWGHGSGPWGGMAATVAWMRWHLGGEDFRKKDFVGTSGRYIDGSIVGQPGKWKGQCKNF